EVTEIVFDGFQDNPYGVMDEIIPAFGEALGEGGLTLLERLFRAAIDGTDSESAKEDWSYRGLFRGLREIADLRGDADGFIAAHIEAGTELIYVHEIAERLHRAGRSTEALEWLERPDGRAHPNNDRATLLADILTSLGQDAKAGDVLWDAFQRSLTIERYEACCGLANKHELPALRSRAIDVARVYDRADQALDFLAAVDAVNDAGQLMRQRFSELNGRNYWVLRPAAEKLSTNDALAASLLYRLLVDGVLSRGTSRYYRHAISDLRAATLLADSVTEWEDFEPREADFDHVQQEHTRKWSFWKQW
ncbi:MAG: hypothetical protein N2C12_08960, partial [Planctomycetales bacterium]